MRDWGLRCNTPPGKMISSVSQRCEKRSIPGSPGGTNGETETTGKGLIDDLTDDLSRGASDAAGALEGR